MRISELSPDLRLPPPAEPLPRLLDELESAIADAERLSPADFPHAPAKLAVHLRRSISRLAALLPLPESGKLQIWKLPYSLSNASPSPSEDHAALRQGAADLLGLAGSPTGIPYPEFKAAAFYHRRARSGTSCSGSTWPRPASRWRRSWPRDPTSMQFTVRRRGGCSWI